MVKIKPKLSNSPQQNSILSEEASGLLKRISSNSGTKLIKNEYKKVKLDEMANFLNINDENINQVSTSLQEEDENLSDLKSEEFQLDNDSYNIHINMTKDSPSSKEFNQDFSINTNEDFSNSSSKDKMLNLIQDLNQYSLLKLNKDYHLTRTEILDKLSKEISIYYQYSQELTEYFLKLFNPEEAIEFFDACEVRCPMTLRTNSLKITRRELAQILIRKGINVDSVGDWTKVGLKVYESTIPVGATPEYLAGYYMIQSASSFLPVISLAPQPGEKILDMAAAPGGKATYIGQIMKNTGFLFANDINRDRCNALVANLQRLGVNNCIVSNYDGAHLKKIIPPMDRVLLDAPCSGLGIISRDPTIKIKRTLNDLLNNSILQKKLLIEAIDICDANSKTGGFVVYSTCSISAEENESVLNHILKLRNVKLYPLGIDFGSPALSGFNGIKFHPSIPKYARRFYPHTHNLDGFFVAKLKKLSNDIPYRQPKDRRKNVEYTKIWGEESWSTSLLNNSLDFPNENKNSSNSVLNKKQVTLQKKIKTKKNKILKSKNKNPSLKSQIPKTY